MDTGNESRSASLRPTVEDATVEDATVEDATVGDAAQDGIPARIDPPKEIPLNRPTRVIPKGSWVGRQFEIVCRLPQTGCERTYVARDHERGGASVFLQVLSPFRSRRGLPQDHLKAGFQASRRLDHRGLLVPRYLELGPVPFLVSDYLESLSLARLLGGPMEGDMAPAGLTRESAVAIVNKLAHAIDFLHAQDVFHGDLRVEGILVARIRGQESVRTMDLALSGATLIGNPDFDGTAGLHPCRAPEWLRDDTVGPAADIYGLAALTYWMLSGRPPFEGPYLEEKILKQLASPIVRIPHSANQVLLKGLERRVSERYRSAAEFSQDLNRALREILPARRIHDDAEVRHGANWITGLQQTFWSLVIFLIGFLTLVYLLRYH